MSALTPVRPYLARSRELEMPAPERRFILSTPYVHGRTPTVQKKETLPSIDEFLARTPPPVPDFASGVQAAPALDEWPSWGGEANQVGATAGSEGAPARSDWQSYDWGSAARLGIAPPDAAAEAWASTDWGEPGGSRESRRSAAEALAHALDQIAHRIRTGELRVPGPEMAKDDAAIAGTLAALLGIRR